MLSDPKDGYWPAQRCDAKHQATKSIGLRELFFEYSAPNLKAAGLTDEQIERRYREWVKSYQGEERV
jgi:hypothetical protein